MDEVVDSLHDIGKPYVLIILHLFYLQLLFRSHLPETTSVPVALYSRQNHHILITAEASLKAVNGDSAAAPPTLNGSHGAVSGEATAEVATES